MGVISTVLFVALNKERVKTVFQLHYSQYKVDRASVHIKSFVFQLGQNSYSEKIRLSPLNVRSNC